MGATMKEEAEEAKKAKNAKMRKVHGKEKIEETKTFEVAIE